MRSITARVPTHEDDTHDDFKPKFNTDAEPRSAPSVAEQIQNDVQQHPVFLYMKVSWTQRKQILVSCCSWSRCLPETYPHCSSALQGVPEAPQCGFSNMACRILDAYGKSSCSLLAI